MDDDREVLASLTLDQLGERARAGQLESEYWQQVLGDLHELHAGVHAIADELQTSTLSVLGLLPLVEHIGPRPLEAIAEANRSAMGRLRTMQSTLTQMLELVDGRGTVLLEQAQVIADALGVELDQDDEVAEP